MHTSVATSVTLFGKGSWGITIGGGKDRNLPIAITKPHELQAQVDEYKPERHLMEWLHTIANNFVTSQIKPGSIASRSNIKPGDVIVAVNGETVKEMTTKECDAIIGKAKASLFLLLIKNGATVKIEPSGKTTVEGNRDVYKDESSDLERLSQYNRSARPYFSSTQPFAPASLPSQTKDWTKPQKPIGFRSVSFNPNSAAKAKANGKENVDCSGYNASPRSYAARS